VTAKRIPLLPAHNRYFFPLTPRLKYIALKMQQDYPKRATSKENIAPGVHPGGGGVNPTVALQSAAAAKWLVWNVQISAASCTLAE
jgi:hypothetical protein